MDVLGEGGTDEDAKCHKRARSTRVWPLSLNNWMGTTHQKSCIKVLSTDIDAPHATGKRGRIHVQGI
jgi:hypothetical protein